jgi:hypothetical protein
VLVRRHLRACDRCSTFKVQLKETNKALAAVLPIGPMVLLKKFALAHLGHSAGSASGAGAAGTTAAGTTAAGTTIIGGSTAGGVVSAGLGALATKAAAGLAAAALVTAGAVEVTHSGPSRVRGRAYSRLSVPAVASVASSSRASAQATHKKHAKSAPQHGHKKLATTKKATVGSGTQLASAAKPTTKPLAGAPTKATHKHRVHAPGRTQVQSDPTVLTPATTTANPPRPDPKTAGNASPHAPNP